MVPQRRLAAERYRCCYDTLQALSFAAVNLAMRFWWRALSFASAFRSSLNRVQSDDTVQLGSARCLLSIDCCTPSRFACSFATFFCAATHALEFAVAPKAGSAWKAIR